MLGSIWMLATANHQAIIHAEERFDDLKKVKWAEADIYYLADRGTVAGYTNGSFAPLHPVTRAQAAAYLVRELYPAAEELTGGSSYTDVSENHYFYKEIEAATRLGLTGGFPDGSFRPDSPVSRAETAVMLMRAYTIKAAGDKLEQTDTALTDITAHWAEGPIRILASGSLIGGYPDRTFRPDRQVNRAEFASLLTRVIRSEREKAIKKHDWDRLLELMSLPEKAGQMLMPDIRMWEGKRTTAVNDGVRKLIQQQHAGGLILFEKNIDSDSQLTAFTDQLQRTRGDIPLFLGIDQEGGVVRRIPGGTNLPGNMALGAARSTSLAFDAGKLTGEELRVLGLNVNFAPVIDINVNADNPIIGIRSFGSDPKLVTELGLSFMKGLKQAGVVAAVKHFPGHGDTSVDSHLGLPVLPHDMERLKEVELKPFSAAIAEGARMIMTAHVAFPAVEPAEVRSKKDGSMVPLPATLSQKVLTGLLREELGYEGVLISDAFTMNAIAGHFGEEEAIRLAVGAGVDIVLMPQNAERAHKAIVEAVRSGRISIERVDDSVRRIIRLKSEYGLFEQELDLADKLKRTEEVVGADAHRDVERRIAEAAVTKLADKEAMLPFKLKNGDRITIIAGTRDQAELISEQLAIAGAGGKYTVQTASVEQLGGRQAADLISGADYVILASYQFRSPLKDYNWKDYQTLIDALNKQSKHYVLMSLGNPYELSYVDNVKAGIAVYGAQAPNILAGLRGLLGQISLEGTLPVQGMDAQDQP